MARLLLRSPAGELDLDGQFATGFGFQATAGATGFGLPPVQVQWKDAAGDGATPRGRRILPRDIDIPLDAFARDRAGMVGLADRLSTVLADGAELLFIEDDGSEWFCAVERTGGGSYVYGIDTGDREFAMSITLRAGDPMWTAVQQVDITLDNKATSAPFLGSLANMPVSPSQRIGSMTIENTGTAAAEPIWTVTGPGNTLNVRLPDGTGFTWNGSLAATDVLTITRGTVRDQTGANRYGQLAPAPRFWKIPPGVTVATVSLLDTTTASSIKCSWRPRRWLVI